MKVNKTIQNFIFTVRGAKKYYLVPGTLQLKIRGDGWIIKNFPF
jgi:hypothetical protein